MDEAGVEAWLLHCMDVYDTRGLHPAVVAFKDVENFSREHNARSTGLVLDDVRIFRRNQVGPPFLQAAHVELDIDPLAFFTDQPLLKTMHALSEATRQSRTTKRLTV